MKERTFSSYIFPVRNGRIAMLRYGTDGYGPIGGRLDGTEDFITALRRELTEELGPNAALLADIASAVPTPYSFTHTPERAIKRGALSEEHHFFIVPVPDDMELNFCEDRPDQISVVWVSPSDLLDPSVTPFDDLREFYTQHIIPRI